MIAAAVLSLVLTTPAPSPDPYQIYKRAMQQLATLQQPGYIVVLEHWITVTSWRSGASETDQWDERRVFDSTNRRECVLPEPFKPAQIVPEIGESYFAPDIWLISHRQATIPAGSSNMTPDLSDLKTIASVVSLAQPSYDIRLVGVDPLTQGGTAYHLSLRPRSDPVKHNLRELWIDTSTHNIMRAIIEGGYRPTYSDIVEDTFVSEDFGRVGPYWLVIHRIWTYDDPFSPVKFHYDATSQTMKFPDSLPAWFFNANQFRRHVTDVTAVIGP
ncbi:MAG TPA: hypothetical protein VGR69_01070 [Candidatus Rubrimentiphilum sp.]|nr:hypothetical protein [Candidatus Rubrimentiphilum sp.]